MKLYELRYTKEELEAMRAGVVDDLKHIMAELDCKAAEAELAAIERALAAEKRTCENCRDAESYGPHIRCKGCDDYSFWRPREPAPVQATGTEQDMMQTLERRGWTDAPDTRMSDAADVGLRVAAVATPADAFSSSALDAIEARGLEVIDDHINYVISGKRRAAAIDDTAQLRADHAALVDAYKLYVVWTESQGRYDKFGEAVKARGHDLAAILEREKARGR